MVRVCRAHGAALVPQGGNTGLVGGGVPLAGEVVLSLARLRVIGDVDASGGQLTAGAAVTLADVHRAAGAAGWAYGVDFASRERATVGGSRRHQRRRPAGAPLRRHAGPAPRRGGGARRRLGDLPPRRAAEGQHRLPPPVSAVRERGDARHRDRRPPPAGAAGRRAGRRPAGLRHGGSGGDGRRRAAARGALARSGRAVPDRRARPRLPGGRPGASVRTRPRGLSAGRGGRPGAPRRRAGRCHPLARRRGRPGDGGRRPGSGRVVALPGGARRRRQHAWPAPQVRRRPSGESRWWSSWRRCRR